MQHVILCTLCIVFYVGVSYLYIAINHMEQGHEEPSEAAQVEDANT
jgi:hypothetical protein